MNPWLLFWIGAYALAAFAIARAVLDARGVAGTLAWIFAILALPGVGAVAYFLLANPSIHRTVRRRKLSTADLRQALAAAGECAPGATLDALAPTARSIIHLAGRVTGLPPFGGNRVDLLTENQAAFKAMEDAIAGARRSVWTEYYIIQPDETGRRFLALLADRARAGVPVRLLYDAVGSASIDREALAAVVAAGGKVAPFLPVNPLRRRWSVHLRNHRKIIVVDGEIGFTGGMNVGDEYSGRRPARRARPWRDTHLALRGPAVGALAQTFAEDWSFATGERLALPAAPAPAEGASAIVALLPSGPDQEVNANRLAYFAGIASAAVRCYLTSPYFIPDEPTVRALESAALRGVDVRVLVPGKTDVGIILHAARSYYPSLLRAGVRIHEYRQSMLHAKTMVVDGAWGIVGSANLDVRSFRLNFEAGAIVCDADFARGLEERFLADLGEAVEVTPQTVGRRPPLARLKQGAARLLSPLL